MSGGAPSRVRSAIPSREFLLEFFVNLFELTGAEDSVRRQLTVPPTTPSPGHEWDFRRDVEAWLDAAWRAPGRPSAGR